MLEELTLDHVREWEDRFSNRGRWGDEDRHGTLNFITRARVLDACALAKTGQIISCALPFDENGARGGGNPLPTEGEMDAGGSASALETADDSVPLPPRWATQWASRVRVFDEGTALVRHDTPAATEAGALADPIDRLKNGVVGRGILLDMPRFARVQWLDDGTRLFPTDLDGCAEASGVTVQSGDIVLVRTGKLSRARTEGWDGYANGANPGLSVHCARWLHEREVAAVATDTACVEVRPAELDRCVLPLHRIAILSMGLLLGETFQLDDLARVCAEDGTYEFLFTAPALSIPTGGGTPINPLAIR